MSDIAARLRGLSPEEKRALLLRLVDKQGARTYPVSSGQQRLWFLHQLAPQSTLYHQYFSLRVPLPADVGILERVLNEIVRRHESLRTTFAVVDGQPAQVIVPRLQLPLVVHDVTGWPEAERMHEVTRRGTDIASQPFDLARGPLLRACLLRDREDEGILLVVLHHIISDGWSVGIFVREFSELFTAFLEGKPSPLPDLPIQYRDFAAWQADRLRAGETERLLGYWKKQLADLPTLELPADRPRPVIPSFTGDCCSATLSKATTERLKAFSRCEGVTPFIVLLATFQVLLLRETGQTDIALGAPVAGRNHVDVEGLIGFFVNTLVMRTDLSGNPPFREALKRVREVTLGAYAHQDLPFEKLVEELHPERDLSRNPLFQVTFQLFQSIDPQGMTAIADPELELDTETAVFDLVFNLFEKSDGISVQVEYRKDLFDDSTVRRILQHYQKLLETILSRPDLRLFELPMLTSDEEDRLLRRWNGTAATFPTNKCVHELVSEPARLSPDSLAVWSEGKRLTYSELNADANRLAHHLLSRGIGRGSLVAVCLNRSPELIIAELAILKTGGAYVPLDPASPSERIAFMLEDAGCAALVASERVLEQLKGVQLRSFCFGRDWPVAAEFSADDPGIPSSCSDLAYVIYTSGSTGTPKGVEIEHGSLLNLIWWHRREYKLAAVDRTMLIASAAFDASVWEAWPTLSAGAALYIPDEATRATPQLLWNWLSRHRITVSFVPTSLWELMATETLPSDLDLRFVLTGGDRLLQAPADGLPFQLVNHYGPTEYTVVATSGIVEPDAAGARAPSIGRPIANTHVVLLDAHGGLAPPCAPGEICIGGPGLARGYRGRAELTQEKFIPSPFASVTGPRLYRTGDRARYLPDGRLEFLGREDGQIKIRGHRVELGEIGAVLSRAEGVRMAAVLARGAGLSAYVAAESRSGVSVAALKEYLRRKLPEYMVPSSIVIVESLPITPNGKVDRKALDAIEPNGRDAPPRRAPSTEIERRVAAVWQEVLRLSTVGVDENFFDVGGHSLLLVRLHTRLREKLGCEVSILDLFQYPTIASFASIAARMINRAPSPGVARIAGA